MPVDACQSLERVTDLANASGNTSRSLLWPTKKHCGHRKARQRSQSIGHRFDQHVYP